MSYRETLQISRTLEIETVHAIYLQNQNLRDPNSVNTLPIDNGMLRETLNFMPSCIREHPRHDRQPG